MSEVINTKERIEVESTGTLKNKKGKFVLGKEGTVFKCHPKVAEKYLKHKWIKPFKKSTKKED